MLHGYLIFFAVKGPNQKGVYDPIAYPLEYPLHMNVLNKLSNTQELVQHAVPYVYPKSDDPNPLDIKVPYAVSQ